MAFGFSPKFIQEIPVSELTNEQFLALSVEAAKKLGWNISFVGENGFIVFTGFTWSSWSEEVSLKLEDHKAIFKSECINNQLFDWGKNKKNIAKLITTLSQLKTAHSADDLSLKYEELKAEAAREEQNTLDHSPAIKKEKLNSFSSIFTPREGYFITPVIIDLNILIFLVMAASGVNILLPDSESLIRWGANFRPETLEGQWWRLITNCFLHIGIIHLLMNMYALLYIGLLLEPYLGKLRFAVAYLLTGIAASAASLWWHDLTISAGASGAIFGMYGVFLALLTTDLIEKSTRNALLTSIAVFVAYNLMNGVRSGIDNAAHIGGLISGLIIGYAFVPSLKEPEEKNLKFGTIALLVVLVLVSSFTVYSSIPNDIGKYDARMKDFVSFEARALRIYNMPENAPKDSMLYELGHGGIRYWNKNIKLLNEVDKLDLPDVLHEKNAKLRKYCILRIQSYSLIYKAINENTDRYKEKIDFYTAQIEALINELGGGSSK